MLSTTSIKIINRKNKKYKWFSLLMQLKRETKKIKQKWNFRQVFIFSLFINWEKWSNYPCWGGNSPWYLQKDFIACWVLNTGKCKNITPYDSIMLVLLEITRWDTWLRQIFSPCYFLPFLYNCFSLSSISLEVYLGKESDNCWSTLLDYSNVMRHHRMFNDFNQAFSLFSLNWDIIYILETRHK